MSKRVTHLIACLALLAPAGAAAARADALPRYDPEATCNELAEFGGTRSEMTFRGCMEMEQQSYNTLKARWSELPASVRRTCDELARFGGAGSYMTLGGCVEMELKAKADAKPFEW